MLRFNARFYIVIALCLLTVLAIGACGAGAKFQKKLELMSDDELLSYYHGLKDQMRDIDRESRVNEHIHDQETDWERGQYPPFFIGGRAHDLGQKGRMIEKELRKRNIRPEPKL